MTLPPVGPEGPRPAADRPENAAASALQPHVDRGSCLAEAPSEAPSEAPAPGAATAVLRLLAVLSAFAALVAFSAGARNGNRVFLDLGVTLTLAASVLATALGIFRRARREGAPPPGLPEPSTSEPEPTSERAAEPITKREGGDPAAGGSGAEARPRALHLPRLRLAPGSFWMPGAAGALTTVLTFLLELPTQPPGWLGTAVWIATWLCAAGVSASAAIYLGKVREIPLPGAPALARGARLLAWLMGVGALAAALQRWPLGSALAGMHLLVVLVNVSATFSLLAYSRPRSAVPAAAPDLGIAVLLGSRANPLASLLDTAERQLGIDLRSTWALAIVRRGAEPLVLGLLLVGWLSTSLTVVTYQEQALLERLGRASDPQLAPGIHLHLPWPIDRIHRFATPMVASVAVGHEEEDSTETAEEEGPENVLWARRHEGQEYTLLLGDGRDLIAIDATVHYRIRDVRAWQYSLQNPVTALRAASYRAVMRSTVDRTLPQALSENVTLLTRQMLEMVQADADELGLGVDILAFTVAGMHPPVAVAADYQAVVSAELGRTSAAVEARAYAARTVPAARAQTNVTTSSATAQAGEALARARGEAAAQLMIWEAQRQAPRAFRFRRRLEALEKQLPGHPYTIVDRRFLLDGGELWLTP